MLIKRMPRGMDESGVERILTSELSPAQREVLGVAISAKDASAVSLEKLRGMVRRIRGGMGGGYKQRRFSPQDKQRADVLHDLSTDIFDPKAEELGPLNEWYKRQARLMDESNKLFQPRKGEFATAKAERQLRLSEARREESVNAFIESLEKESGELGVSLKVTEATEPLAKEAQRLAGRPRRLLQVKQRSQAAIRNQAQQAKNELRRFNESDLARVKDIYLSRVKRLTERYTKEKGAEALSRLPLFVNIFR